MLKATALNMEDTLHLYTQTKRRTLYMALYPYISGLEEMIGRQKMSGSGVMDPNSAIHPGIVASPIIGTIRNIVYRSQELTGMILDVILNYNLFVKFPKG